MSAGKRRTSTYWFTHRFTPAVLAASIMTFAAFADPIIGFILAAPVWIPASLGLAFGVACIVGWLVLEHRRLRDL